MQPSLASFFELEVFDCVGDVHRVAVDAGGSERLVENAPRRSDEGVPCEILCISRLFADEDDARVGRALAENRLRRIPVEVAAAALVHFPLQYGDRPAQRHVGLGAGLGPPGASHLHNAKQQSIRAGASGQIATRPQARSPVAQIDTRNSPAR